MIRTVDAEPRPGAFGRSIEVPVPGRPRDRPPSVEPPLELILIEHQALGFLDIDDLRVGGTGHCLSIAVWASSRRGGIGDRVKAVRNHLAPVSPARVIELDGGLEKEALLA